MVKRLEVFGVTAEGNRPGEVDLVQAQYDLVQPNGRRFRLRHPHRQRVHVTRPGNAPEQICLQRGCAASGKRIEHHGSLLRIALDAEIRQLRLEAPAVAHDIVQRMHLALLCGPELTD